MSENKAGETTKKMISLKSHFSKKIKGNETNFLTVDANFPRFREKIFSPEQALSLIKPGNRIFIGTGCATPATLMLAMEHLERNLEDIKPYHFFTQGVVFYRDGVPQSRFHHRRWIYPSDRTGRDSRRDGEISFRP